METPNEKSCIRCGIMQSLDEYYLHNQMADGHVNVCKTCTRKRVSDRFNRLILDPEFADGERKRGREKYHRYKNIWDKCSNVEAKKKWETNNPEKKRAAGAASKIPCPPGFHKHHWSYKRENWKDVVILSIEDHGMIHRFLDYVESELCFSSKAGDLLDTKDKHLMYINGVMDSEKSKQKNKNELPPPRFTKRIATPKNHTCASYNVSTTD
jgi:hypothetical protein